MNEFCFPRASAMPHFIKFTHPFYCDSRITTRFVITFFVLCLFLVKSLIFGGFGLAYAADAMFLEPSKPRQSAHSRPDSRIRARARLRPSPAGVSHSSATSNPKIIDDALGFVNDPEISPLIEKMIENKLIGAGGGVGSILGAGGGGILGALSGATQAGAKISGAQGTDARIERATNKGVAIIGRAGSESASESVSGRVRSITGAGIGLESSRTQSRAQSNAQTSIRKIKIEKIANRTPFSRNWAYYPLSITSPTNPQKVTEFQVQIPKNRKQKQKGLMFRTRLADEQGMLFTYRTSQNITMWMENTYIPLDMVFIAPSDSTDSPDKNRGKIVDIIYNTKPLSRAILSSPHKAIAVLELKAGTAHKFNLQIGSVVEWNPSNAINTNR